MHKEFAALHRPVRIWLLIGVVMVFIQVVVGGITRLTDSGLSITEWAVIQGTIPPLNAAEWQSAFEEYQVAAGKQFRSLHADMTISEFKWIFFWEYMHRLWARLIGFVFLFPFFYFLWKGWLPKWLNRRLGVVILLAAIEATMGWIMVSSGLNADNRTWVSAYKLVAHLSIATILFGYLYWTYLLAGGRSVPKMEWANVRRFGWGVAAVLMVQIVFGGLMAGMRAGLIHPHWPLFVESGRFVALLQNDIGAQELVDYEASASVKAWVQIFHRITAYLLTILLLVFVNKFRNLLPAKGWTVANILLVSILGVQFTLGVLTVINSVGSIPIVYGTLHQCVALLLLAGLLYHLFRLTHRDQLRFRT